MFLWLPSADFAVQRVADRVRMGGNNVPEATVRRRYERGLRNFFRLYQSLAATWAMYDNSEPGRMRLMATGQGPRTSEVLQPQVWERLLREYGHGE